MMIYANTTANPFPAGVTAIHVETKERPDGRTVHALTFKAYRLTEHVNNARGSRWLPDCNSEPEWQTVNVSESETGTTDDAQTATARAVVEWLSGACG